LPRLEAVLDSLVAALGEGVLDVVFDRFVAPAPNRLHRFFARHLREGGSHLTLNFDDCIDCLVDGRGSRRLLHLHGRYDPGRNAELGALVGRLAQGLPEDVATGARDLIRPPITALVVVGYSARDYFDVDPFFASPDLDLAGVRVIWIEHDAARHGPTEAERDERTPSYPMLVALRESAAEFAYVRGDTESILTMLSRRWFGEPPDGTLTDDPPADRRSPVSVLSPSFDERVVATAQLWTAMGVGREVLTLEPDLARLAREGGDRGQRAALAWSNALRDVGLYRRARKVTRRHLKTPGARLVRAHRLAGDYWLQGAHLRAALHFLRAWRAARTPGAEAAERYETAVTFMHWWRDLERVRALGRLVPGSFGARAWHYVDGSPAWYRRNPHVRSKLEMLSRELRGVNPIERSPSKTVTGADFAEVDSFTGVINSRRRDLREGASAGELLELLRMSQLTDDRPGIVKHAWLIRRQHPGLVAMPSRALAELQWTRTRKLWWLLRWFGAHTRW
jgi:hypothetical protein